MSHEPTSQRVAIYVSSATRNRLPALHSYVQEHGWRVASEYVDEQIGGEALDRMIRADQAGEHDAVVGWNIRDNKPVFLRPPRAAVPLQTSSETTPRG